MKVRTGILMMAVGTGMLWAQNQPAAAPASSSNASQSTATKRGAKPAATKQATTTTTTKTAAATTTTTTKTKTTAPKAASDKAATAKAKPAVKAAKKPAASTPAADVAKKEGAEPKTLSVSQKRDPFLSPVQTHVNGPINCGTGKRCLVVDQTMLEGIVKAPNGMIAVVSNSANKAYFLRENDPVYNGYVMRITPDSVVFREEVTDRLGKKSTREIVKKVNAPAV